MIRKVFITLAYVVSIPFFALMYLCQGAIFCIDVFIALVEKGEWQRGGNTWTKKTEWSVGNK